MMTKRQAEEITALVSRGVVKEGEPMSAHTTFRVGGAAALWVEPDAKELFPLVSYLREASIPYTVVGNGSNLLVSDGGYDGVVLHLGAGFMEVERMGECLTAGAGILLSALSNMAAEDSLSGLEFASGIPGTLGGGVVMNAGAYGGELKDVITSVTVLEADGLHTYSTEEMEFSYRHSRLSAGEGIVVSVTMTLSRGEEAAIRAQMREYSQRRQDKQPLNFPSAGSTFKRPPGHFAGQLIEEAGLRGHTLGGAAVSEKHCGFLINRDHAAAADIYALIRYVQERVWEVSGIRLEPEVRLLGDFDTRLGC